MANQLPIRSGQNDGIPFIFKTSFIAQKSISITTFPIIFAKKYKMQARTSSIRTHQNNCLQRGSQPIFPIGLINTGNSCFLNAIIQFIYGMKDLKAHLIDASKTKHESNLSFRLGSILQLLKNRVNEYYTQRKLLSKLAQSLYHHNIRSMRYSQQDATNIFLNILTLLEQEYRRQIQAFDMQYKAKCQCYSFNTVERILSYRYIRCSVCNGQIRRTLITAPKYIIYRKQSQQRYQEKKREEIQGKGFRQYSYKAQIIYHDYGSKMYGHYIARRMEDGRQYQFDDSFVRQLHQKREQYHHISGILMLYQLVEPRQTLIRSVSQPPKRQPIFTQSNSRKVEKSYTDINDRAVKFAQINNKTQIQHNGSSNHINQPSKTSANHTQPSPSHNHDDYKKISRKI